MADKPDFNTTAKGLSFGFYRPELPEDSFAAGWNLLSQELYIRQALEAAFERGKQAGLEMRKDDE